MQHRNSEAVSPVVGVMLMLVVTIIIAAVVSAFAGGLSSGKDKAPTATITATYSQTYGMTIMDNGGDPISTSDTIVMVRPSKTFGTAEHQVSIVNKSTITDSTGNVTDSNHVWLTSTGMSGINSFGPGDTAYILPPYHTSTFLQSTLSPKATYQFNNTANIGKTFWLEFATKNGNIFARTEVKIQP
jgi:FlaG/FlaF family flagellin (archaellin)